MTLTIVPVYAVKLEFKFCQFITDELDAAPTTDTWWFPLPRGTAILPEAPAPVVNGSIVPANSTLVNECFDPNNVDYLYLFNTLLPKEQTAPVFYKELSVTNLLRATLEITPVICRTRAVAVFFKAAYTLVLPAKNVTIKTKIPEGLYDLRFKLTANARSFSYSGGTIGGTYTRPITASKGAFVLTDPGTALAYNNLPFRTFTAEVGAFTINPERKLLILSHFDSNITTDDAGLSQGWSWPSDDEPVLTTAQKKFGAAAVDFSDVGFNTHYLYTYIPWSNLDRYDTDFCFDLQFYIGDPLSYAYLMGIGNEAYPDFPGYIVYFDQGVITLYAVDSSDNYTEVFVHDLGQLFGNQWAHLALEQSIFGLRLYFNGQLLTNNGMSSAETVYEPPVRVDLRNAIMLGSSTVDIGGPGGGGASIIIDEVRLVNFAPYLGDDFTPPSVAYPNTTPNSGDTILGVQKNLIADPASFNFTGQAANIDKVTVAVRGELGAFAFSGVAANLSRQSRKIIAENSSFSLTGKNTLDVPTLVGSSISSGSTDNATINWPAGHQPGDLAILLIETSALVTPSRPTAPMFGWTAVPGSPIVASGAYLCAMYKFATSNTEPAVKVPSQTNHQLMVMAVYRGVDTASPIVTTATATRTSASTSITFPTLTGSIPRAAILNMLVSGQDTSTSVTLSSIANTSPRWINLFLVNRTSSTLGDGGVVAIYHGSTTHTGTGLPGTTATSNLNTTYNLLTMALRPKSV